MNWSPIHGINEVDLLGAHRDHKTPEFYQEIKDKKALVAVALAWQPQELNLEAAQSLAMSTD